MFSFLKRIFPGMISQPDWDELFQGGAILVDVRSKKDFQLGHAVKSVNIPLSELEKHTDKLRKINKPIIVVCGSGYHSATAKEILNDNGVENVYTGGMWFNFQFKM